MQKLISYPISCVYYLLFGIILLVFHPIQWICLNIFGYQAHKKSVDIFQWTLLRATNILGTRYTFDNPHDIPTNTPVIIAMNHQSLYDIPPLMWYMRKHHTKFISKKELEKGIPSVSFNLKYGGSVSIDRKDRIGAVKAIEKFGNYIETTNRAAVIFPEGTRSKTGKPRPFQAKGLLTLFEHIPSANVVPVTINNSWKMQRYGFFPMGLGNHIKYTVHPPMKISDYSHDELLTLVEEQVTKAVVHDK